MWSHLLFSGIHSTNVGIQTHRPHCTLSYSRWPGYIPCFGNNTSLWCRRSALVGGPTPSLSSFIGNLCGDCLDSRLRHDLGRWAEIWSFGSHIWKFIIDTVFDIFILAFGWHNWVELAFDFYSIICVQGDHDSASHCAFCINCVSGSQGILLAGRQVLLAR